MPLTALTNLATQSLPAGVILLIDKIHLLQRPLFQDEEPLIRAVGKFRAQEFIAGRSIAREAIHLLGLEASSIQRGDGGEPIWAPPVIGSISHKGGFCGAIVAKNSSYMCLGLDIEFMEYLDRDVWKTFCCEEELGQIPLGSVDVDRLANILFCSKESFFKVLYPVFGKGTPSIDKIHPTLKMQTNHIVTAFNFSGISAFGSLVYDDHAIISWAAIKNTV